MNAEPSDREDPGVGTDEDLGRLATIRSITLKECLPQHAHTIRKTLQQSQNSLGQRWRHGLVEGSKLHVDASLIDAYASSGRNVVNGPPELIAALKHAYGVEEQKFDHPQAVRNKVPKYKTSLSLTDPDAPLIAHDKGGAYGHARPRYKHHGTVDDQLGVITAVETTAGSEHESASLNTLVQQHEQNSGLIA